MQIEMAGLQLSGMTQLGSALRGLGAGAESMEQVAQETVKLLYDSLIDASTRGPACSLVRVYRTMKYRDLPDSSRHLAPG